MKLWAGVTDNNWYKFLSEGNFDEVNLPAGRQASGSPAEEHLLPTYLRVLLSYSN